VASTSSQAPRSWQSPAISSIGARKPLFEIHQLQADDARPGRHQRLDVGHVVALAALVDDQLQLHSLARQVQPRVDVGGEGLVVGDHLVTGLPVETEGDDAQALGGALEEGDIVRLAVDEAGGLRPHPVDRFAPQPVSLGKVAGGHLLGELTYRFQVGARGWSEGRMVEPAPLLGDRELALPDRCDIDSDRARQR